MGSKLRTTVSASAIALGIALSSQAARAADPMEEAFGPDWYVSVFGGMSFARGNASYSGDDYDIRLKDGYSIGAAMGRHLGNGFRAESELSYVRNSNKSWENSGGDPYEPLDGETSAVFMLGNLWKDFRISDRVQPYVGGGLGTAYLMSDGDDNDGDGWDDSSIGLAAQFGAGVRFAVTDRMALEAGYRLKAVIDASFDGDPDFGDQNGAFSFYSHSAQLGLSYALGEGSQIMSMESDEPSAWYVSVFGGGVFPEKTSWEYNGTVYALDHKTGFTIGAAVGTHLAPGLRAELELSYLRAALDSFSPEATSVGDASGHLEQAYLLANVWKDFNLGMISPYIGGGVGFGSARFDNGTTENINGGVIIGDDTGYGLAGQFGVGARMAVGDNMSVDLGYRFKSIVDAFIVGGDDFNDNQELATHNHIVQLGLNYSPGEGGRMRSETSEVEAPYVSLFGGGVFARDTHFAFENNNYLVDFKTGFTVGAVVGSKLTESLRGEVEMAFQTYDADGADEGGNQRPGTGKIDSYFLLANLWRDYDMGSFQPYVGGGIGMALMDVHLGLEDEDNVDDSTIGLAAQVGSGVRIPVSDSITLDAGYRFKAAVGILTEGIGAVRADDHTAASHYSHVGQLGVTWTF